MDIENRNEEFSCVYLKETNIAYSFGKKFGAPLFQWFDHSYPSVYQTVNRKMISNES